MAGPKILRPESVPATWTPPLPTRGLSSEQQATLRDRYTFKVPDWLQSVLAISELLPAAPIASALDMGQAARIGRAVEQGYTKPAYHGTKAKLSWMDDPLEMARFERGEDIIGPTQDALKELKPSSGGLKMMDGMGVHVGTAEAANQRLTQNYGKSIGQQQGAYVLPLRVKAERPLTKASGDVFTETELQSKLSSLAKKLGHQETRAYNRSSAGNARLRQAQRAVKQHLEAQGYDSIPYRNSHEDRGSVSWILFHPSQARSQFAAFDPAKLGSPDLLAGLGGIGALTRSAILEQLEQRPQP